MLLLVFEDLPVFLITKEWRDGKKRRASWNGDNRGGSIVDCFRSLVFYHENVLQLVGKRAGTIFYHRPRVKNKNRSGQIGGSIRVRF